MRHILLTGGAGYIGSHTLLALASTGQYKLTVFDNLANGHREAVEIVRKATGVEIDLVQGELQSDSDLENLFAGRQFDAAIHFAALIEAGVSVVHPTKFFQNNTISAFKLLQYLQKNGVRKLVFSSTAAVYGTPSVALVTESTPLNPESAYGSSKRAVEMMLQELGKSEVAPEEQLDSVILRYFNAAGADPELRIGQDYPKPTHLITVAASTALGMRDKLTIYGQDYPTADGTCVRDYIHVSDLARAHVHALDYAWEHTGSEIFNIGTSHGASNLEVVKLLEEIHGQFNWEFGPRRAGDPVAYYADNSKARTLLGWEPKYGLREIVQHSYNWLKKYPRGYADMEQAQ